MVDHNTTSATQEVQMKVFNEDTPIYLQLRRHIEELILNGHLKEEEAIPSIRIMARDYSINPLTVGNALSALMEEGILYKKRGVGIFVTPGARQQIIIDRSGDFIEEKLKPILQMARQLELPRDNIQEIINEIYGGKDVR
jgi:DNA-binding transcriptional regulator YhcF (GntR family)